MRGEVRVQGFPEHFRKLARRALGLPPKAGVPNHGNRCAGRRLELTQLQRDAFNGSGIIQASQLAENRGPHVLLSVAIQPRKAFGFVVSDGGKRERLVNSIVLFAPRAWTELAYARYEVAQRPLLSGEHGGTPALALGSFHRNLQGDSKYWYNKLYLKKPRKDRGIWKSFPKIINMGFPIFVFQSPWSSLRLGSFEEFIEFDKVD